MYLLGFLFFFFKELAAQTGENTYDSSCYTKYDKGVTYKGTVSTGFFGNQQKICKNWKINNSNFTTYYPDHNYCRNPRPDAFDQPWCYIDDNLQSGKCNIPVCGCRTSTSDLKYNGSISTSRNGHTCRLWTATRYINLTANYCRTPYIDRDNGGGPWCYVTGGWDRCNIPVCGGSFCPDLSTYHLLTSDKKSKYQYGEIAVVVSCQKGYHGNIEKTYLGCSSTGTWNDTVPTCEKITCQPFKLDINIHASIQPNLNKYGVNTSIRLSCIHGYTGTDIEGLCQENGQWSTQQTPNCTEITCPPFILDNNVHASIQPDLTKYVFNTSVTLSCIPGYTGSDKATVCQANSQWSSQQTPRCRRSFCPDLSSLLTMDKKSKYQYGEIAIVVSCQKGYHGNIEKTYLGCSSTGTWNNTIPTCEKITCPPFILDNNVHTSIQPDLNKYVFNTRITLSCIPGYTGSDKAAVCQANGQWSSQQPPSCRPVNCKRLHLGGHVISSNNMPKFNDVVTLSCEQGYFAEPIYIKCDANGYWPLDRPDCSGVPCPHLPMIDKALLPTQTKEYRYPEALNITCETGYVVEGSGLLQCNSSGFWNSIPRCICIEGSQSYKDSMENRGKGISYGLFGGILAAIVSISTGLQIATCFYYRKRVGKPAAEYEDMQFNTVERQRSSKEETYSELT